MTVYSRNGLPKQPADACRVDRDFLNARTKRPAGRESGGSYSVATTRPHGNDRNVSARTHHKETRTVSYGFRKYRSGSQPEKVQ